MKNGFSNTKNTRKYVPHATLLTFSKIAPLPPPFPLFYLLFMVPLIFKRNQNKPQSILYSRKSVCRTPFTAVFNAPYLEVGVENIWNATPVLRAPKMPRNRFRPQNRLRRLKNTKSYALLAFSVTLTNFPPFLSPKNCPYLNLEGEKDSCI